MSIHGVLAALLGSSALGGYAPLTLLRAQRYYITGTNQHNLTVVSVLQNIYTGLNKNSFYATEIRRLTIEGFLGTHVYSSAQHFILGFYGLMPTVLDFHTLIDTIDVSGYGANYGASYGG